MKKFLIGVVCGIIFSGFAVVMLFFAAWRIGNRQPIVADGSTLILKLEGEAPEQSAPEIPIPFFEAQSPLSVQDVWLTLRKAAVDSRIKAVVFEPRGLTSGWAKLQEFKQDLEQFRKSGKPLIAFLRGPSAREYYLATAADKIYMAPEDTLDLKGLRIEAEYLKNTLDKIGVRMEVIHAGKYKDAEDMFTRASMSPETREVLDQVLDQFYGNLVETIAAGRKKTPEQVRALIDQGPFPAAQAFGNGLVDTLGFEDQASSELAKRLNQKALRGVSERTYLKIPASSLGLEGGNRIALVVGSGEIVRTSRRETIGSDSMIAANVFIKTLREVGNDSSIKGAILRIDSPGGDGVASDDILHEAKNLSRKKPVVISMSDYAASGGYFISMTGDPIVAYPNTLTGSIGVIFGKLNLRGLYDKIGIQKEILSRGQFSGLYSDYTPLDDKETQKLRDSIDRFYAAFVTRVAEGRKRKYEDVEPLAQGRVWLGVQAKQNGLIDELGGLDRAIELVKQRAHVAAGEKITLVTYPPKKSLLELLMTRTDDTGLDLIAARTFRDFPVRSWLQGGFMKVIPYGITVK